MIRLTVSQLVFLYTLSSVITILIIWIMSNYKVRRELPGQDTDFIWKCSVCFNTYIDSKHDDISVCPQCGSYNKKENKGG